MQKSMNGVPPPSQFHWFLTTDPAWPTRYGRNDAAFLTAYPEANQTVSALLGKIRKARKQRAASA